MKDTYIHMALNEIQRIFGLLDRNELSQTYGCFDRSFWKYKIKDYFNARFQEAAYTLAILYTCKHKKNIYYKDEKIKKWAIAACEFWAKNQEKNGSFNEYMPKEQSHVATAFSSLCICETYVNLKLNNKSILVALEKSAEWLNNHDDLIVINHDAGCIPFFYLMYKLTQKKKYLTFLEKKLSKVLSHQNNEGWFYEYGGADIGYQSYSIYFLSKYYKLSKDKRVLKALESAVRFFSYFIHPDGTCGGTYGSRDTNFIIPAGFENLSDTTDYAFEIAKFLEKSLTEKKIPGPYSFDDRFICEELYVYLDFEQNNNKKNTREKKKMKALPYQEKEFTKLFSNCGLLVAKKKEKYIISNLRKCAIGLLFSKNKLEKNIGTLTFKNKKSIYATYGPSEYTKKDNEFIVKGWFYKHNSKHMGPIQNIGIRLTALSGLSSTIKELMRKSLILSKNKTKYSYAVTISLDNEINFSEKVDDRLKNKEIKKINPFSPIYSTSVGFYNETK